MAAAEDPCARALLWLGALALRARRPARRLCGSVRLALVYAAALLGAFLLMEGSLNLRTWWSPQMDTMVKVIAVIAILGAIGDIFILTAILGWGRFAAGAGLTRLLCGRLALASAHLPLAVVMMLWAVGRCISGAVWWPLGLTAWEAGRFAATLVVASLTYCLLLELHPGEESIVSWVSTHVPSVDAVPAPAAAAAPAPTPVPVEEPTPGPAPPPRRHH
ncbi:hypothetical protein R5R35_005569 [Gryllus longicercus]|uniref:Uncharacterized protein n=1 Tax=Gryllus longicercus TaxID=2509291 RepID=A0AAN9VN17_9ORTH